MHKVVEYFSQDSISAIMVVRIYPDEYPEHSWLCGYIGVPCWNYFYEWPLEQIEAEFSTSVHGGVTFAGKLDLVKGQEGWWYIGFDCHHAMDQFVSWDVEHVLKELEVLRDELMYYNH